TWGDFVRVLPLSDTLPFHRFIGAVHLAAILLIGLGGEWIWRRLGFLSDRGRGAILALVVLVVLIPALRERRAFYALDTQAIERTLRALETDGDARAILASVRGRPPGRSYAGRGSAWGKETSVGDLRFDDLLTFERIASVNPDHRDNTLGADVV